jgi:hypothetical protein
MGEDKLFTKGYDHLLLTTVKPTHKDFFTD